MGYYIGQFYIDKRDMFLLLALLVFGILAYTQYPVPLIDPASMTLLLLFTIVAKGFIPPASDSALFIAFFVSVILSLFAPLFHVLVFMALAFAFLRLFKTL